METLYRKVAVSDREPKEGWVLTPNGGFLFMDNKLKCAHSGQEQEDSSFTHWLEPIPDPTAQLQADKDELLERLEEINILLNNIYLTDDRLTSVYNKNRSLIQKHKPCEIK